MRIGHCLPVAPGARRRWVLPALALLALFSGKAAAVPAEDPFLLHDASRVNEGELHFMLSVPSHAHQHHNSIRMATDSLSTGWVKLRQCHRNLDAVSSAQIVFHPDRIRDLTLEGFEQIGAAWVEGASIQMRDIGREAMLCLSAESRSLHDNLDGSYSLRNGPFMRRFLDGYYPMQVTMDIQIPSGFRVHSVQPLEQPGFRIWQEAGMVNVDARFEGRLSTVIRLIPAP
jgi:hypothetical protein